MRELDLQAALGGRCASAEDFEDQAGTVDHFRAECGFEIALLNRAERRVDDDKLDALRRYVRRDRVDLADAEQGCGARLEKAQRVQGDEVGYGWQRKNPRLLGHR